MDSIVCVTSPHDFDELTFRLWTEGKTVDEIALSKDYYQRQLVDPSSGNSELFHFFCHGDRFKADLLELLKCEVKDQFQIFSQLEHYFRQPKLLTAYAAANVHPIHSSQLRDICIEKYWSLDDCIVREIVSKQRLTKSRKDLDDICETTGLNIRTVTRQFDNLKNLYNYLDEKQFSVPENTSIVATLSENFCFKGFLLRKYTSIMFLLDTKFNLTKKRMQRVSCESLELCAAAILSLLVNESAVVFNQGRLVYNKVATQAIVDSGESDNLLNDALILSANDASWGIIWGIFHRFRTIDLDKQLLSSLRDIRSLIAGENLELAITHVIKQISDKPTILGKKIDKSRIRSSLKSLMQIGSCLSQTREFRDLFEDLLEKIVIPMEELGLALPEINTFMLCCASMMSVYGDPTPTRHYSTAGLSGISTRIGGEATLVANASERVMRSPSLAQTSNMSASMGGPTHASSTATALMPGGATGFEGSQRLSLHAVDQTSIRSVPTSLATSAKYSKAFELRRDWLRFVSCCRLCILELVENNPLRSGQLYRLNLK